MEACKGNEGDCNNWRINKVSIVGKDLDFMSSDSMKKYLDHFLRNMVYGRFVHFKGGSTL